MPIVTESKKDQNSSLQLVEAKHPCLIFNNLIESDKFVANSIQIGNKQEQDCFLITGPNMGGKSTLLRTICLNVILA